VVTGDELVAAATAQTGLDDFGEDSFRPGLHRLVQSLGHESNLNAAGEAVIYPRLVQHLANRLHIEDWYRRHPEIDEVPIAEPLIGLSLPRTGSTALSFLLAQDPGVRYLRQWECSQPCPPPSTVEGEDPRLIAAMEQAGGPSHVPTDLNGPVECLDLMALDFRTQIYLAFAKVPGYAEWLVDADLTSTYRYERRTLKLLQWGEPDRPWRLKSPAHMLWIEDLVEVFPDARFVMTHRDPSDVLLSVCGVYADIAGRFTDDVDLHDVGRLNVEQWATGIDRVMRFRDRVGDDRFYDIDFRAMEEDPIGQVGGLYGWLDRPVSEEFAVGMRRWWDANRSERADKLAGAADKSGGEDDDESGHRYGLDLDGIRSMFADYVFRSEEWVARDR
jgi:Sulfotransferase family